MPNAWETLVCMEWSFPVLHDNTKTRYSGKKLVDDFFFHSVCFSVLGAKATGKKISSTEGKKKRWQKRPLIRKKDRIIHGIVISNVVHKWKWIWLLLRAVRPKQMRYSIKCEMLRFRKLIFLLVKNCFPYFFLFGFWSSTAFLECLGIQTDFSFTHL